ncbi:unnamed protein product [Caenorhabditis sp. 36 PRJEB53466]|nr:unnamed protein product [Caenorhabditis sp. 36 PRJEB53466]
MSSGPSDQPPGPSATNQQCPRCPFTTKQPKRLREHVESHDEREDEMVVCPMCQANIRNGPAFQHHLWAHESDRPYKCVYCEKGFARQDQRDKHYMTHAAQFNEFECPVAGCNVAFSLNKIQRTHLRVHEISQKNVATCKGCTMTFDKSFRIFNHYHINHGVIFRDLQKKAQLDPSISCPDSSDGSPSKIARMDEHVVPLALNLNEGMHGSETATTSSSIPQSIASNVGAHETPSLTEETGPTYFTL